MSEIPSHREEILEQVDSAKVQVYELVREVLDTFEVVAPWEIFYEPSSDDSEMLEIHHRLVEVIEEIPQRAAFRHLEQALSRLIEELSDDVMDQITKTIFIRLLDRHSAEAHTPRTREVAKETLDHLPDEYVEPSIKELLKFLIDRNAGLQITDEVLSEAIDGLPEMWLSAQEKQITKDLQFYFRTIHEQIEVDLTKIKPKLGDLAETIELFGTTSPDQRQKLYILGTDLKGKCVSSLMGAAAGLIAEGRWSGPEIETILFPEKLEEAERNEQLAVMLDDLLQAIRELADEIPLRELIGAWRKNQKVDRYALTPLYKFLAALGDVIKAKNRRAIYLADFYELHRRENLLIKLVNELNELNQKTWEPEIESAEAEEIFRRMIRRTLEMAAVLDVGLLRHLIGENNVANLRKVVVLQERRLQRDGSVTGADQLLEKVPERLRTLPALLHEDDLSTFLSFLQSAVLKRATFALRPPEPPAPPPPPAAPPPAEPPEPPEAPIQEPEESDSLDELMIGMSAADISTADISTIESPEDESVEDESAVSDVEIEELEAPDLGMPDLASSFLEDPAASGLESEPELAPATEPGWNAAQEPSPEAFQESPPVSSFESPSLPDLEDGEGPTTIPEILAERPLTDEFDLMAATEDLDLTLGSQMIIAATESADDLEIEKREALQLLQQLLEESLSPTNSGRKAFLLVHRIVAQKRMVPLSMLRSVSPYLDDLMNLLVPQIMMVAAFYEIPPAFENLTRYCQEIMQSAPTAPDQIEQVAADMNRVDRLLHGLQSLASELLAELPDA